MKLDDLLLKKLLQTKDSGQKISFFHSTQPVSTPQAMQEDIIRFKNALQAIRSHQSYDETTLAKTMSSLDGLIDNRDFWSQASRGLAVFAHKDGYQTVRLNYDVTEAHYLSDQYQVSPLVLMNGFESNYYLLDINHTRPRLIEGSPAGSSELVIEGMPGSFESETGNIEFRKQLQHQAGGVGTYHGHTDKSALQDNMMSYYRGIAEATEGYLANHNEPLVLMGVESRVGSLRSLLSYANILDEHIEGSGEAMNEQELHERAYPIVEKYTANRRRDLVEKFHETSPELKLTGQDEINKAIAEGRVETLLLPTYRRTADTVRDEPDQSIVLQISSEDTETESLVRSALNQGGTVEPIAIDAFGDEQPRALCRF